MIGITIITKSCFKVPYLHIAKKQTFITGEKYELSAKIENMGTTTFPGGDFQVIIQWPNGLAVFWNFKIGALAPKDFSEPKYGITDVLDDGPALFLMKGKDINGKMMALHDKWGNRLAPQTSGFTHVHTIIPKNAEELYQLWALIFAAISLVPILIKDVIIPFSQWLISVIN